MSRARGLQLYALLLRLYPKASRHEYEAGMIEMFELRAAEYVSPLSRSQG